jgi:hypothetical protein
MHNFNERYVSCRAATRHVWRVYEMALETLKNRQESDQQQPPSLATMPAQIKSSQTAGQFFEENYSLANCADWAWKTPAPDTWEAIRKAATTAGTLISLRN